MSKLIQAGKLAFRREGDWWRCYWKPGNTTETGVELGSIRMSLVSNSESPTYKAFMECMRLAFSESVEEHMGIKATWPHDPTPAPENERSGNA